MKKQNTRNEEFEITKMLYENKWEYNEEIYLKTFDLMENDEEKIEKAKKLLENRVLEQIKAIFNRNSPYGNLDEQSVTDWLRYIFWEDID